MKIIYSNVILIILTSQIISTNCEGKVNNEKARKMKLPPCRACKVFVDSFKMGMERTAKFKFEGGDTDWEEKKLGSYANSEIRFVEIHEKLCSEVYEGKDQCYLLLEKYDEALETWWFKNQKTQSDLHTYLCIDTFQDCCPDFHFGKNCTPCKGFPDNICYNNGKCKGAGTRKGNGKCMCDSGYSGDYCDSCSDGFFESYRDNEKVLCSPCHSSCEGQCTKEGPLGCDNCKEGYMKNKNRGCVDVNECLIGKASCGSSKFCVNTEGSFKCLDCHVSCLGCSSDGPDECKNCAAGYVKKGKFCVNYDEEERKNYISFTRYITYFGLCVCTCIILQKNVSIAAIVGVCVAIYITLSEYISNSDSDGDLKNQLTEQLKKAFGSN